VFGGDVIDSSSQITVTAFYNSGASEVVNGWCVDNASEIKNGEEKQYVISFENAKTYLLLQAETSVTISFDANGGSFKSGAKIIDKESILGDSYATTNMFQDGSMGASVIPTRNRYDFLGWFTKVKGGNPVTASDLITSKDDQTLYAHWSKQSPVHVTFDPNGGVFEDGQESLSKDVYKGEELKELPLVTRKGFTFQGWFTSSTGGKKVESSTIVSDNTNYFARWEAKPLRPSDAVQLAGHYFMVYDNNQQGWDNAEAFCESVGGHLATITSQDENILLFQYMTSNGYQSAYFGLTNTSGNWAWVTGVAVEYTNWAPGEPNNESGVEHYGMFYWKNSDGTWNDGDFGSHTVNGGTAFLCEWDS